ncbi:hypothetical protein [Methanococcus maripaludis]|uniref:Uncharacterized protein n=1 Tax=Methanococcus maripaludis TaxID=39152 RepID=A0A2L1C8L3_METMI|nr:hypothetical protein [Methanococcus maripaludis]AVB75643.1 hypothetical protein MMJJ_02240 [Methanococcus maripaludis]
MKCFPIPDGKIKAFPIKTSEKSKKPQNNVQQPQERVIERVIVPERIIERPVERIVEVPVERVVEKPIYQNRQNPMSNAVKTIGLVIVSTYIVLSLLGLDLPTLISFFR